MTAIITNTTRVFNSNQFLNSFQTKNYTAWQTATPYSIGNVVYNSSYKYIAVTSGTSGAIPPSHTSGVSSDGAVDWLYVESFTNTSYFENNIYVAIGKQTPWYDFTGVIAWADSTLYTVGDLVELSGSYYECLVEHTGDGVGANSPDTDTTNWKVVTAETPVDPQDDFSNQYSYINNIMSAKRLNATNVSCAIKRVNWASGTVYDAFDPTIDSFAYVNDFYVLSSANNIYKCVDNNNGAASTSEPTGTSVDITYTTDGYGWKYMGTVSAGDALAFLTAGYIPVKLKLSDDGSNQWLVQENAKSNSISSAIVTAGGSGYTTATVAFSAPDLAGGVQATGSVILNAGVCETIQMTNVGSGYTSEPTATITGDGTGAEAVSVLAPKDGHGANILTELDARYSIVNARFDDTEGGYFPITGENDFRQLSLIVDPREWDGGEAIAARYIGPQHDDYTGDGTSGLEELEAGSGNVIYIESIAPVVRTTGQIEDIKIVLRF